MFGLFENEQLNKNKVSVIKTFDKEAVACQKQIEINAINIYTRAGVLEENRKLKPRW